MTKMATASDSRHHLHQLVDELSDQHLPQATQALEALRQASLEGILRSVPGLRMPDHWPPQFVDFEPLPIADDELPSEQLIRERRRPFIASIRAPGSNDTSPNQALPGCGTCSRITPPSPPLRWAISKSRRGWPGNPAGVRLPLNQNPTCATRLNPTGGSC
jgi:hypothetical protein